MMLTIAEFDAMPDAEAAFKLAACCGSSKWVASMLQQRPFGTRRALLAAGDAMADKLERADWLEAFTHHPRIGERNSNSAVSTSAESWSAGEQSAVSAADTTIRGALVDANAEYEERFGFIFIIRAAGRGAKEILGALHERMANDTGTEIFVAAREQRQITRLRLEKLIATEDA